MKANRIYRGAVQVLFVLSLPFFTLMVVHSALQEVGYVVSLLLSFVVGVVISKQITENLFAERKVIYMVLAFVIALYLCFLYAWQGNGVYIMQMQQELLEAILPIRVTSKRLAAGLILASFPSVSMLCYVVLRKVFPYIQQFVQSFDKFEKRLLVAVFLLSGVVVTFCYLQTSAYYYPIWEEQLQIYDVLYTTDSGGIYASDCYVRVLAGANDIRQPLFGLFAIPFSLVARIISMILFFLPNAYAIGLGIVQYLTEAVAVIMLSRIMKLEGRERFFFVLLNFCSYAVLLHGIVPEQYTIAFFYVILTLYVYKVKDGMNYAYYGAVSTLLTSGILFGLITKARNMKKWIADIAKAFVGYVALVTVCGQLPQFLGVAGSFEMLASFTGEKVTWLTKWQQFTHFVKGMLWAPEGNVEQLYFPSYRSVMPGMVSWIGIIILCCVVAGFIMCRKEWISQIAMAWVGFSVVILLGIGWGTAENGLLLYALYFAWAYIILLFRFLKCVCKNQKVFVVVMSIIVISMLLRNGYELLQIFKFGVTYYPL